MLRKRGKKPRLLDLYCCQGGGAQGYAQAGFEVVGVDKEPQPKYPYEFHRGDALSFLRKHGHEFDAIHASPPCQKFSAYRRKDPKTIGAKAPDLIAPTRKLLNEIGVPWVMENVEGAPMPDAVTYCGSMFGLDVRRHRLFESNISLVRLCCAHHLQQGSFPPAGNRTNMRKTCEIGVYRIPLKIQKDAMGGCDWMTLKGLSQAIPPAYTRYIGLQLIKHIMEL